MDGIDLNLTSVSSGLFDSMNNILGKSPLVLLSVLTMVVLFVYLVPYLGNVGEESKEFTFFDNSNDIFEIILWCIFTFLVIINGAYFLFGLDVDTSIKNIFGDKLQVDLKVTEKSPSGSTNLKGLNSLLSTLKIEDEKEPAASAENNVKLKVEPKVNAKGDTKVDVKEKDDEEKATIKLNADIKKDNVKEANSGKEVFHVPGNKYSYKDSQAICKAYGSRLATYDEVENSYNKGGEWCSYGWSDNQLALFPTQKDTYNKLQEKKGHEHDCGRPGVNGGYIDNDKVKFGVNCFGYKPKMKDTDKVLLNKEYLYPKTEEEHKFERDVDKWRNKIPEMLISPFNNNKWSKV